MRSVCKMKIIVNDVSCCEADISGWRWATRSSTFGLASPSNPYWPFLRVGRPLSLRACIWLSRKVCLDAVDCSTPHSIDGSFTRPASDTLSHRTFLYSLSAKACPRRILAPQFTSCTTVTQIEYLQSYNLHSQGLGTGEGLRLLAYYVLNFRFLYYNLVSAALSSGWAFM